MEKTFDEALGIGEPVPEIDRSRFMELSEEINALDYLEKTCFFITQAKNDTMAWKWVILSIHLAIYGFAICALKGTCAPLTVMYKNKKDEEMLISFPKAIERCQKAEYMRMTVWSKPLVVTEEQQKSIDKMHKVFRNNFEHFAPCGWIIEISGMPKIVTDCLEVARFLALDTGNYTNLTSKQKEKIKHLINQANLDLEEIWEKTLNQFKSLT